MSNALKEIIVVLPTAGRFSQACSFSTIIGSRLDPHNDTDCPSDGSIEVASPMSDLAVKSTRK
jgi:hypothetical protein